MQERFEAVKAMVNEALELSISHLPKGELTDAMRYATLGGKRVRALLVMESARLNGISDEAALPVAAAVEALHAYSLIHDDLPAMDDDDLRRGLPTCHIQWSEATAILAGDALQTLAFRLLTDDVIGAAERRIDLITQFAKAVGAKGMVRGQSLDIQAEEAAEPLDEKAIIRIQEAKTGALIEFSAVSGAIIAGNDPEPLRDYARNLGLAFQIADDILDVTGDEAATGKRVGKDERAGKATFVSLLGLDAARAKAEKLSRKAEAALEPYGEDAGNLRALARFVIERDT